MPVSQQHKERMLRHLEAQAMTQSSEGKATEHTPGPWRIKDTHYNEGERGQVGFTNIHSGDDIFSIDIATLYCTGPDNDSGATQQANARLIAAAPAFEEAAHCYVRWVDKFGDLLPGNTLVALEAAFGDKMRAAIARIEGRASPAEGGA